ncbi:MAG: 2OG-Fe(II) oxygenase [Myxococcota bacterium]
MNTSSVLDESRADRLAGAGLVTIDHFLGEEHALRIRAELFALRQSGVFRPARVGTGPQRRLVPEVRQDEICWFEPAADLAATDGAEGVRPPSAVAVFFERIALVMQDLNTLCYLGLRRFECHGARYGQGAFYRPHVDSFVGDAARVVSFAYFLNPAWTPAAGGELRIHGVEAQDIAPVVDRLVLFRADNVLHEVRPVLAQERYTLTGWMRR